MIRIYPDPGGVIGAGNLTTAGSVVYVSAAGVVSQDAFFSRTAAGQWKLYNSTATTGVTTLTVRAGAGQSSTNLQEWRSSSDSLQAFITGSGYANFAGAFIGGGVGKIDLNYYQPNIRLASDYTLTFSSTTSANGTPDLGLARSSANNLGVTDGASTTYATIGNSNSGALITTVSRTISGGVTDGYTASLSMAPTYSGAFTVTRHNYIEAKNATLLSSAVLTDAALVRFDAAAGTHKAVDSGTTKTSPGTVSAWVKVNVNGTIYYMPAYSSKTS